MNIVRGILMVLFIAVVAGIIAYIGDRVGHQVGRKRLTLFNIRPRYTSTIIAVATGMLIAIVVTLVAIFASNQVQTAFFHLAELNAEITRAQALENKVNNAQVVIGVGDLMFPNPARIPANYPPGIRSDIVHQFYQQIVTYADRIYTRPGYGLKKFTPPSNVEKMLDSLANGPQMQAFDTQSDVYLIATADQNLYRGDEIHFGITPVPDKLLLPEGQPIAYLVIPAGKNASERLALAELLFNYVPREMQQRGMLPYSAQNVQTTKLLPDESQMRSMLASASSGTFIMTAFSAQDIWQHTFGVPVVVTLQRAPAQ